MHLGIHIKGTRSIDDVSIHIKTPKSAEERRSCVNGIMEWRSERAEEGRTRKRDKEDRLTLERAQNLRSLGIFLDVFNVIDQHGDL